MSKRPRDPNQLASLIVSIAVGEKEDLLSGKKRKPSPKRAGGVKGGKTRARTLSAQQRQEIARLAAKARWKKTT
jgi:hypothetical protein